MANGPYHDDTVLRELYQEELLNVGEIADKFDVCNATILYWMDKHSIKRRTAAESRNLNTSPYQDRARLERLYHQQKSTTKEMAEKFGCSRTTVEYWMDKYGIERRDQSDAQIKGSAPYTDAETLRHLYHEQEMTVYEIAERFGRSYNTVLHHFEKHGIERRSAAESRELRGTNPSLPDDAPHSDPEWLREKYHDEGLTLAEVADEAGIESAEAILAQMQHHGIERRAKWDHLEKSVRCRTSRARNGYEQIAFTAHNGDTHYYDVHRLVAIGEWGLEKVAGMHVHHKNGIRWDNRPSNLELLTPEEHRELHEQTSTRDEYGRYA